MTDVIRFTTFGYGDLRLAKQYCSKDILENLFQTEGGIIVCDKDGEEVFYDEENKEYSLNPSMVYTVVSEKDLESDSEEDYHEDIPEDVPEDVPEDTDNTEEDSEHKHHGQCCDHEHESELDDHVHDHDDHVHDHTCDHHHPQQNQNDIHGFHKLLKMREYRIRMINENYAKLHPEIFNLNEEFFEPKFLNAVKSYKASAESNPDLLFEALTKITETDIYSLKIFNMDFCQKLLEEIDNFKNSGLPTARANSMNNYGLVLDEIGFTEFFNDLRKNYLNYFTSILYPRHHGDKLDSHHAFIVQYEMEKEVDLAFHYDESDVTLNLCLGKQFTGGSLYFKGILNEPETHDEEVEIHHSPGTALLHIGTHRHGANNITSGERTNLILWLRYTNGQSDE